MKKEISLQNVKPLKKIFIIISMNFQFSLETFMISYYIILGILKQLFLKSEYYQVTS